MTLEEKIKEIESYDFHLGTQGMSNPSTAKLIKALRKAIEQRDKWMHDRIRNEFKDVFIYNANGELLSILNGETND